MFKYARILVGIKIESLGTTQIVNVFKVQAVVLNMLYFGAVVGMYKGRELDHLVS